MDSYLEHWCRWLPRAPDQFRWLTCKDSSPRSPSECSSSPELRRSLWHWIARWCRGPDSFPVCFRALSSNRFEALGIHQPCSPLCHRFLEQIVCLLAQPSILGALDGEEEMRKGNLVTFMNCHRCCFSVSDCSKLEMKVICCLTNWGRQMETNELESVAGYNLEIGIELNWDWI